MSLTQRSWIFLRGLTREKAHWGTFKPLFEERMNAVAHCIDFPGVGEFFAQESPTEIAEITDHVIKQSGDIQRQSWLLAHSMGCLVAADWMNREPHRFLGAVFINTSFRKICPVFQRLRLNGILKFLRIGLSMDVRRKERLKYMLSSNIESKMEKTVDEWLEIQKKHPVTTQTTLHQIQAALYYKVVQPRYPILLLNSLGDKLVDPNCSKAIAEKWNLPIQTHSWTGHEITLDDPSWVIDQVDNWLKTNSSATL